MMVLMIMKVTITIMMIVMVKVIIMIMIICNNKSNNIDDNVNRGDDNGSRIDKDDENF